MTTAQKIIKYLAMAFAIFLIVTIISSILTGIYVMLGVFGLSNNNQPIIKEEMSIMNIEDIDIATLEIDVDYSNITIKRGDYLKAETNSSNVTCNQNNQRLQIKQKNHNWLVNNNDEIVIYIPEWLEFEKVNITTGAGNIDIEELNAQEVEIELGAGNTQIKTLNVYKQCDINGGAGKLEIASGEINKLDIDMGIGKVDITSKLTGKSDIDAGVGELNINLEGNQQDYQINVEKGLGSIIIDGKEASNNQVYGNGDNYIDIDGGVGVVKISFSE